LAASPETPIILDAIYENHDQEYRDVGTLNRILPAK
jgi:hypothetical protein